jgi:DNA primase
MNGVLKEKVKIISKTDIYNIIADYVDLTAKDRDYHGDCPFCKQSGKFAIAPSKGMFYCFGCQKGGDPITFLQLVTNKTSEEIMTELAAKYGLS